MIANELVNIYTRAYLTEIIVDDPDAFTVGNYGEPLSDSGWQLKNSGRYIRTIENGRLHMKDSRSTDPDSETTVIDITQDWVTPRENITDNSGTTLVTVPEQKFPSPVVLPEAGHVAVKLGEEHVVGKVTVRRPSTRPPQPLPPTKF